MASSDLIEGTDYYRDERGLWIFTASYLIKRGYCCGTSCRHCPYQPRHAYGSTSVAAPANEHRGHIRLEIPKPEIG